MMIGGILVSWVDLLDRIGKGGILAKQVVGHRGRGKTGTKEQTSRRRPKRYLAYNAER